MDKEASKFLYQAAVEAEVGTTTRNSDEIDWSTALEAIKASEKAFPTHKFEEDELFAITDAVVTHNLAKIVDKSPSLKRLVDLGVKIWKWEREPGQLDLALRLDFKTHVGPKMDFLRALGVQLEDMVAVFEANPQLLVETSMDECLVRKDYLVKMGFTRAQITAVLSADPQWLSHAVEEIDSRLGFLQRTFELSAADLRQVAALEPKLVTWVGLPDQINLNLFSFKEEMGFDKWQITGMLKACPLVFRHKYEYVLMETFDALAVEVGFSRQIIAKNPHSLLFPASKIRDRLAFLKLAGRDQFDPKKPNFISIDTIIAFSDNEFSKMVNVDSDKFDRFLKTL